LFQQHSPYRFFCSQGTQEIGGNAALMARKFYELSQKMGNKDVDILVAGSLPESLRSTLPEQIRFVDGAPTVCTAT